MSVDLTWEMLKNVRQRQDSTSRALAKLDTAELNLEQRVESLEAAVVVLLDRVNTWCN